MEIKSRSDVIAAMACSALCDHVAEECLREVASPGSGTGVEARHVKQVSELGGRRRFAMVCEPCARSLDAGRVVRLNIQDKSFAQKMGAPPEALRTLDAYLRERMGS
jgi:hypothetical protein